MFGPPSSERDVEARVLVVALVERGEVAGELRLGDPLELELDRRQRGHRGTRRGRRAPPRRPSRRGATAASTSATIAVLIDVTAPPPRAVGGRDRSRDSATIARHDAIGAVADSVIDRRPLAAACHGHDEPLDGHGAARYSMIPSAQASEIAAQAIGYRTAPVSSVM